MNKNAFVLIPIVIIAAILIRQRLSAVQTAPSATTSLHVAASFYPLAEFASQVGGPLVSVHNLTPAGSEPHDFDPTPSDLVTITKADIFIYNGAGLELWLNKLSGNTGSKPLMINATEGIALRSTNETPDTKPSLDVQQDPHTWLNPVLASQEVDTIKQAFITADPAHATDYQRQASAYQQQLAQLDHDFRQTLSHCTTTTIVTSHDAFEYLAQEYGLSVTSISGLTPDAEPSPQKMASIVQLIQAQHIKYVFFESLVSPKLAQTIAQESGAQTIVFNPLEGLTDTELAAGKNYVSVQEENLAALKIALQCQ